MLEPDKWSYRLLRVYRNARYLGEVRLCEPVMTEIAKVIWADEDGNVSELDKLRVITAFDALWEACECGGADEVEGAFANLRAVIARLRLPTGHHRDHDTDAGINSNQVKENDQWSKP